jgi:hypothetical protein
MEKHGKQRFEEKLLNCKWGEKAVTNGAKCFTIFKAELSRKCPNHPKLI